MQKVIVVKSAGKSGASLIIDIAPLNQELAAGWRFVAASPFGLSASVGGQKNGEDAQAAMLVIIEKF